MIEPEDNLPDEREPRAPNALLGSLEFPSFAISCRSRPFPLRSIAARIAILILFCALSSAALASGSPLPIVIDPAKPVNHWLAAGTAKLLPAMPDRGLVDIAPMNIGWFDFDFVAPESSWWKLALEGRPHLGRVELEIDPLPAVSPERMAVAGSLRPNDWVWLEAGPHRLRVIQNYWTGFPQVSSIRLEAPDAEQTGAFRVIRPIERPTVAIGHCSPLQIEAGGVDVSARISIAYVLNKRVLEQQEIQVPASSRPERISVDVPCSLPGDVTATVSMVGTRSPAHLEAKLRYSVFDTRRVEPSFRRGELVTKIDVSARKPDFESGSTALVHGPAGEYRETGDEGVTRFIRSGKRSEARGWFAYRLPGLTPGRAYLLDVEYPDDAPRAFVVAFRDAGQLRYATSIGAETGVVWPLSDCMKHMNAIVWPASSDARVLVFNIHDGMKAAVATIRVYAVDLVDKEAKPSGDGREVVTWYEEGDSFSSLVGMGHDPEAVHAPVDRYLRLARSVGTTMVLPTVVVYSSQLYPSNYNLNFNEQGSDITAAFLLGAQRYGMKVVPELHPRADELLWPPRDRASLERRLLLSGKGDANLFLPDGSVRRPPYYNALDPDVRRWYANIVGELAERYRDYPAFAGISLRTSYWANAALNNLVSLDWGYDAATLRRYFDETRAVRPKDLDLGDDSPEAAKRRHDILLATQREDWIRWRCEQIRDVYRDLVAAVRSIRPDLKIFIDLSVMSLGRQPGPDQLREAGIDSDLLNAIEGLALIDARFGHGAREGDIAWRRGAQSEFLRPGVLDALAPRLGRPSTLSWMQYIEIPGEVWPSSKLELSPLRVEPWVSSAIEPPDPLRLARYAQLVGLFDVYMLGDGGNGYVFGGDGLLEFLKEFRSLPRARFEQTPNVPMPLIVRQHENMFYVTNLSSESITAKLDFDKPGSVSRVTNRAEIQIPERTLSLVIEPYSLLVFRSENRARVVGAEVVPGRVAR